MYKELNDTITVPLKNLLIENIQSENDFKTIFTDRQTLHNNRDNKPTSYDPFQFKCDLDRYSMDLGLACDTPFHYGMRV